MEKSLERGLTGALLVFGALALAAPAPARAWTDAELSAIAHEAYVFTLPLYEMYRVRYQSNFNLANPLRVPPNRFLQRRALGDHTSRTVTTPNNDTLYSSAFLNLAPGPLLLEVPAIPDRYYSLAFIDFYTNNFAYVGTRTTGTAAGRFVIAGPGWNGTPPAGAKLIRSPTNAVWLLGRFQIVDASDLPRVHAIQDRLKLEPLPGTRPANDTDFTGPVLNPSDPWNFFAVVNHALTENPPPARDRAMLERFAKLDIGPGRKFDASRFSEPQRKAILAGVEDAKRLIRHYKGRGTILNGWAYPTPGLGNFGDDFTFRAAAAVALMAALEREEAIYLYYVGEALSGERRYRLRFTPATLLPVDAFWSLSLYEMMPDGRLFFAENPLKRYAIGDRTPGLKRGADGALDIYIGHAAPEAALASNWLPAPAGRFALVLRAYLPRRELLDGSYAVPPLERLP